MGRPCHREADPVPHLLGHLCCLQISPVENLLVVVHPDLSQAHLIACNNAGSLGEGVGTLGAEHVADHRAGDDLQLAPALPHLTRRRQDGAFRRVVGKLSLAGLFSSQDIRPQVLDVSKCYPFNPRRKRCWRVTLMEWLPFPGLSACIRGLTLGYYGHRVLMLPWFTSEKRQLASSTL